MKLIEWPYYRPEFLTQQNFSYTFLHRFWSYIKVGGPCWLWTGYLRRDGYGQISKGARHAGLIYAHVAMYTLYCGAIPVGGKILHSCDNPACVTPWHLRLGTQAENVQDMINRNRQRLGEDRPDSKLTNASVLEGRKLYAIGLSQRSIAKLWNVSHATARAALTGQTWKHVSDAGPGGKLPPGYGSVA